MQGGAGYWLPQGISVVEMPEQDRCTSWTDVEDDILWELVAMRGRNWTSVATELTDKLAERNMPKPQHSVNADACRGRYDRLRQERGAADDEPDSIQQPQRRIRQPQGRPPKDKVWDAVRGKWVDDPARQNCDICKLAKGICRKKGQPGHLPRPSGTSASGGGAKTGSPTSRRIPQPQGRPPKGKVWDSARGRWIDAQSKRAANTMQPSRCHFDSQVEQLNKLKTDCQAQVAQLVAERGGSEASHLKDISCRYLVPVGFSQDTADRWLKGQIASHPKIEQAMKNFIGDRTKTTPDFPGASSLVDGLGLAAKEAAAQAELRTKRKRYDEERAAIKRRYDEQLAAIEQRWEEDAAGSEHKLQKIRDLRKEAKDLVARAASV